MFKMLIGIGIESNDTKRKSLKLGNSNPLVASLPANSIVKQLDYPLLG